MLTEIKLDGLWRFKGYTGLNGKEQGAHTAACPLEGWLLAEAPPNSPYQSHGSQAHT